jgi:hypothetical protein
MPFNTTMDGNLAPFNGEIMTLTNDECVEVKTKCEQIAADFVPNATNIAVSLQYIVATYNKQDWKKAVNGLTYELIDKYDPAVNTQGIDPSGILPEPGAETQEPEQPEPQPTEGE